MFQNTSTMKSLFREACQDSQEPVFVLNDKVAIPEAKQNTVRIQVKATGLSYVDNKTLNEVFKKCPQVQYPGSLEVTGIVDEVGPEVTGLKKGDRVAGILPLDSEYTGCAKYCIMEEYNLVKLPDEIGFQDAAAVLLDGVKAYTALHYQAHLCGGDTVLVIDGATSVGSLMVQLAQAWGGKVIATYGTADERNYLETLPVPVASAIELNAKNNTLHNTIMEETGGIGVDILVDNRVQLFGTEEDKVIAGEDSSHYKPFKHEVISCLGLAGRWITSQLDLQLDPPNSQQLFMRSASVSFVFEHAWMMAHSQHGRFQHILTDLLEKVASGILRPHITKKLSLENAVDFLSRMKRHQFGKAIVQVS